MDQIAIYIIAAVVAFAAILFAFAIAWIASRKRDELISEMTLLQAKIDDTEDAKVLRARLEFYKADLSAKEEIIRQGESAKHFLNERPTLDAERKALEEALASRTTALSTQIATIQNLTERADKLVHEIASMEGERDLLEKELARLKEEKKEKETQATKLQADVEAAKGVLKTINKDIATAESKKDDLTPKIAKLEKQNQDLESAAKQIKDDIAKLQTRIDTLQPKVKEFEAIGKALEGAKAIQKEIAKTNEILLKDLATIAESRKTGNIVLRQAAFEGLIHEPPFSQPKANKQFDTEATALAQLNEYVHRQKFDLPTRLLYAFHTSLKTSDISSLTVMAGVSGTGKSALPNLYAKAMGIHIVSLAVEPRWDSPKDLLGFFNYVTNRYETTQLAKALFQFQGYHNGDTLKPDPDLRDYMFMAMLDEMNLARIEYYFSEFLSKLEDRRRGKMDTLAHRRKIGLEVFPGAKGCDPESKKPFIEQPIQLFANYNTLFVGTMNEDETTQSLSDKVIDRANVLYFGRPTELQPRTEVAENIGSEMLRREVWEQWHKEVENGDTDGGHKFHGPKTLLWELNGVLTRLGRPFAHRSYQAMLSYLANYPYRAAGIDEANLQGFFTRPLADQIGMRIMPKLRGLDLSQHANTLDAVSSILGQVGDKTLIDAFGKATNRQENRSGFFQWQGMNWELDEQ
jgi:hypothetical protein